MKFRFLIVIICASLSSCWSEPETVLVSPDDNMFLEFSIDDKGKPSYEVFFKNKTIITKSSLGFDFENTKSFSDDFKIINSSITSFNETWKKPWGEQIDVVNNYNELRVELQEKSDLFNTIVEIPQLS